MNDKELKGTKVTEKEAPKKKRRRKGCWIAVAVVVILVILAVCSFIGIIALAGGSSDGNVTSFGSDEKIIYRGSNEGKVAVVDIKGMILQGEANETGGAITGVVLNDLRKAASDDQVRAVIINIESPGGEVVASDIIYNEIEKLADDKPVVAYSSTTAASGGYMAAMGADHFMIHPQGITGSIGVVLQTASLEGLYEKLGIETATIKSDEYKTNDQLFDDDPDGELDQVFQEIVDDSYDRFVEIVMKGRGMNRIEVEELADGRIYSGEQAVKLGLADDTGYFENSIAKAYELAGEDDLSVVRYQHLDFFSDLFDFGVVSDIPEEVAILNQSGVKVYYLMDK